MNRSCVVVRMLLEMVLLFNIPLLVRYFYDFFYGLSLLLSGTVSFYGMKLD